MPTAEMPLMSVYLHISFSFDRSHCAACPVEQFMCHDRSTCVPKDRYQDGKDDCDDGSDEGVQIASYNREFSLAACTIMQFECSCGWPRCIDAAAHGDGIADCYDGSDERPPKNNCKRASRIFVHAIFAATCFDGSARRRGSIAPLRRSLHTHQEQTTCNVNSVFNRCREDLNEQCQVQ